MVRYGNGGLNTATTTRGTELCETGPIHGVHLTPQKTVFFSLFSRNETGERKNTLTGGVNHFEDVTGRSLQSQANDIIFPDWGIFIYEYHLLVTFQLSLNKTYKINDIRSRDVFTRKIPWFFLSKCRSSYSHLQTANRINQTIITPAHGFLKSTEIIDGQSLLRCHDGNLKSFISHGNAARSFIVIHINCNKNDTFRGCQFGCDCIPKVQSTPEHSHLLDALLHAAQNTCLRQADTGNHLQTISFAPLSCLLMARYNFQMPINTVSTDNRLIP